MSVKKGGVPYRQTQFYENCEKRIFDGVGKYDIPQIEGIYDVGEIGKFIGWNYARSEKHPEDKAVHFFVDDYQFNRLWTNPNQYIDLLRRFQYVFSPDFSPYADFPKAVQVFNHFRKHWIAAYLQEHGVNVIPTVTWSYPPSYDFCFDGEPKESVVAVSSVGCMRSVDTKKMFMDGYNEMIARLNPSTIIFYGTVPDECKGNIIRIKSFQDERFSKAITEG
jgi:hypothetical protein